MDNCPCEKCIVKVMCKTRTIEDLMSHCPEVRKFTEFIYIGGFNVSNAVYYESDHYDYPKLEIVHDTLKPSKWCLSSFYAGR